MKKSIFYILLIVLIMTVFTGCKNKETEIKEEVTSEDVVIENDSNDDVIQDNNNSSYDNTEIESTETENEETENTQIESNENIDKENENKENENNEKENKENENKESVNKGNSKKENEEIKDSKNVNSNSESNIKENTKKEDTKKEDTKNDNKENVNNVNESKEENKVQNISDMDLVSIIKKIYEIKDPGLKLVDTPVDLSNGDSVTYYTGLSDISKVKEAVASEAMIGSQAYSLVLVKLNDAKDAEVVANEMLKGIDPRKWICVEADDLQIVSHEDVIMLIMVSTALEERVTSQQVVDAFKEVCNDKLNMELKK